VQTHEGPTLWHAGSVTGPVLPPASPARAGRGLVIAGAIITVVYLVPALALIVWFVWGLIDASEARSMVFLFWLIALLALTPLWLIDIALLGVGRSRQRGPVRGATAAWVLAVGGLPAIGALISVVLESASSGQDGLVTIAFVALVVGIPVLLALALGSGAWLTWGRPRAAGLAS